MTDKKISLQVGVDPLVGKYLDQIARHFRWTKPTCVRVALDRYIQHCIEEGIIDEQKEE